jgi:acyl-CoA synthetase (AMP-forming)/AMP-acid ligase II
MRISCGRVGGCRREPGSPARAIRLSCANRRSGARAALSGIHKGDRTTLLGGAHCLARPASIGRASVTTDVRIVDDAGTDCREGDVGELWVRGPNVFAGYWEQPDATVQAFHDRWFKTGDLGRRDAQGFYDVVDRKKDLIIRGGAGA